MITGRTAPTTARKSLRLTDILGLAAGVATLVAVLTAVIAIVPNTRQQKIEISHEEIIENARKAALKVALEHREGSIVFVDPELCQEHSFDNWTGGMAYKEQIDCDARIANLRKTDADRAAERMRTMSEAFRR